MGLLINTNLSHPIDLDNPELWESFDSFLAVWDALHTWFEKNGYILYPRDPTCSYVAQPCESEVYRVFNQATHPFAPTLRGDERYRTFNATVRKWCIQPSYRLLINVDTLQVGLWAAVDKHQHDVVIKLVQNDSSELMVAKKLSTEPMKSDPNNFTIPILDILKYDQGYSFIVMPRYGWIYLWL